MEDATYLAGRPFQGGLLCIQGRWICTGPPVRQASVVA